MKPATETRASWAVTLLAVAHVAWTAHSVTGRVPGFRTLYVELGAEVPVFTEIVLAACSPAIVWTIAAVVVAFLVAKELRVASLRVRTLLNIGAFLAAALAGAVISEAISRPMRDLIERIG